MMNRSFIAFLLAALALICGCSKIPPAAESGLPGWYLSGGPITDSRWRGAAESLGRGTGIHLSGLINPLAFLYYLTYLWSPEIQGSEPQFFFPHVRVAIRKLDAIVYPEAQVSAIEYDSGHVWTDMRFGVGVTTERRGGLGVRGNLGLCLGVLALDEERWSAPGPYAGAVLEWRFVLPHRLTHSFGIGVDYAVTFNRDYRRGYFGTKQDVLLAYRMAW